MTQCVVDNPADAAPARARQAVVEQLLNYAEYLAPEDRALVRGVYLHGMTASALALAMGCSHRRAHERLRQLRARMADPLFNYVVRERLRWTQQRRDVADAIVLRAQTQRETAQQLGVSVHRVRQEIDGVRVLAEQQRERGREREWG